MTQSMAGFMERRQAVASAADALRGLRQVLDRCPNGELGRLAGELAELRALAGAGLAATTAQAEGRGIVAESQCASTRAWVADCAWHSRRKASAVAKTAALLRCGDMVPVADAVADTARSCAGPKTAGAPTGDAKPRATPSRTARRDMRHHHRTREKHAHSSGHTGRMDECATCDTVGVPSLGAVSWDIDATTDALAQRVSDGRMRELRHDVPLKDMGALLESDLKYTIATFVDCLDCGRVLFWGLCIRGSPILRHAERTEIDRWPWGTVPPRERWVRT